MAAPLVLTATVTVPACTPATVTAGEPGTGGAAGYGNASVSAGYGVFPKTFIAGTAIILEPAGALYGAITRLEERGLIEPLGSDDRRLPYQITSAGSAALAGALADMRRVTSVGLARLRIDGQLT